jgi:hypothetical protein
VTVTLVILWIIFGVEAARSGSGQFFGSGPILDGLYGALGLLFISIICTLGISLTIWIPLWYFVGWLTIGLVRWLAKIIRGTPSRLNSQQPESARSDQPTLPKNRLALVSFITKAREKGLTDEQIILQLKNNGWAEDEINWALDFVNQMTN